MKRSLGIVTKFSMIIALLLGMSACMKDLYEPPTDENPGEVTLDNYFDFGTTKSVQLNVDYGSDCPEAYFEVYAENPLEVKEGQVVKRKDLLPVASGFTNDEGVYDKQATITASITKAYIYSPDFGVPQLYITDVTGNSIAAQISFDNAFDASSMVDNSVTARASNNTITQYIPNTLGTWNNNGKPNYLTAPQIKVDNALKKYITTYFKENVPYTGSYITDNADITILEDANVALNYLGGTTDAKSVFAYYCYNVGASKDEIKKAAQHACVIFPNAHSQSLGNYSGVGAKLRYINPNGNLVDDVFPANTKIGFLIWNNGWTNGNNGPFANNVFYSTSSLNKDGKSHTTAFGAKNGEGKEYNVITMEDWGDFDLNDVAFVISSNPIEAIEIPSAPEPGEREGTDIYRGILGYEDNWPTQGDYDMNDVVLKYVSNVDYNISNKVVGIIDKFTLTWTGANYKNGFAYEVPFDLSGTKVTVSGATNYSINGNVIVLFNDARAELGVSDLDAKEMASHDIKEKVYTVTVSFDKPAISKEKVVPPYNPFIKQYGGNSEVHLTNYKLSPSGTNQFPQGADISDGKTTFFVCKDRFPFAIHLDGRTDGSVMNINLKTEGIRIDKTFPLFSKWALTRDPSIVWWKK